MNADMVYRHFVIDDELIDEGNVQAVIEPLWWSVSVYDGETEMYDGLERFTEPQSYVWAIQWYISEVENGGHDRFFRNFTGIVWQLALEGLNAIGCLHSAEILTEAIQRIGGSPSFDREQRLLEMKRHNAGFDDLDDAFYSGSSSLEHALCDYIQSNREDFYFDGEVEMPAQYAPDDDMFIPGAGSMNELMGLYGNRRTDVDEE